MRSQLRIVAFVIFVLLIGYRLLHRGPAPQSAPAQGASATASAARASASADGDVAVPQSCTDAVNQRLAGLLAQQESGTVDNVMVCGTTISPSRTQSGGPHGSHQVLPLLVSLPGAGTKLVEVVTNDDLDGVVTAPKDAEVFAYGQAFFPSSGRFVAGIHDVHCATHRGADNGWVVVNGSKSPASCTGFRR